MLAGCERERWATLTESLICTEKPENFAPVSRTSYDVSIHNVAGPEVNIPAVPGEGFFNWRVAFEVERTNGASGHIIQEVNYNHKISLRGNEQQLTLRFWEAWSVDQDQTYPNERDIVDGGGDWDDVFGYFGEARNSKGFVKSIAIVRFYEGDLPDHFAIGNVEIARGLPSSETSPDFWEYQGTAHTMGLEWDLTSSDEKDWWWQYTVRYGNQQRSQSWGQVPPTGSF